MKKKLSVLLSLLILALAFSSNAFAEGDPLSDALGNAKFSQLFNFLEQQGFSVDSDQIIVTTIDHSPFSNEQNIPVNMTVTLVPFIKATGESARIAYWNGTWGTRVSNGALATIGENHLYIYNGSNVRALSSSKDLARIMNTPLYAVLGSVPSCVQETTITVTDSADITIQPTDSPSQPNAPVIPEPTATNCKTVDVARVGYTTLGFLAWKFHQSKYFCYNGSTVSSVTVTPYVSNMDPLFYYQGIVSQSNIFGSGNSSHTSMRQGRIDNCISTYGCIASLYPAVQIKSFSNGSYTYSTWQ